MPAAIDAYLMLPVCTALFALCSAVNSVHVTGAKRDGDSAAAAWALLRVAASERKVCAHIAATQMLATFRGHSWMRGNDPVPMA